MMAELLAMPETVCTIRKGAVWWVRRRHREGHGQTVLQAVLCPDHI
jgi:phosphohistidine phosphatase